MPGEVAQFVTVLDVLHRVGILQDVVIVGGWAKFLYQEAHVVSSPEFSSLRTDDIDVLFPRPPSAHPQADLETELKKEGFRRAVLGDGSTMFESLDLDIEFLIPDRGRGDEGPYRIESLAISAQSLRFVEDLLRDTLRVPYGGHEVNVPDPIRFCFHKLLVSERRMDARKKGNDLSTAYELGAALVRSPVWLPIIRERFQELPPKRKKTVLRLAKEQANPLEEQLTGAIKGKEPLAP
ncbi:MAG TPA: GSU2403 family nucleotidyltransferase fold protein [Rectinemataceae bacterium]|nr:GSU2403 family nucleotidyltransferase fold protein [Rectinemataceae bacterium]